MKIYLAINHVTINIIHADAHVKQSEYLSCLFMGSLLVCSLYVAPYNYIKMSFR